MSVETFSEMLTATSASRLIRETDWIVPAVQSVHILAICVVVGSALMLDLRLMRLIGRGESVSAYTRRYSPWLSVAVLVLFLSGVILIVGEPSRTLLNWVFWTKMALLSAGIGVTALVLLPAARERAYWDGTSRYITATFLGMASLAIWASVIVCGRWIAYTL